MHPNEQRVIAIAFLREVVDRWERGNLSWPFRKQVEVFLDEVNPKPPTCRWCDHPAKRSEGGRRWLKTCRSPECLAKAAEAATRTWRKTNGPTPTVGER